MPLDKEIYVGQGITVSCHFRDPETREPQEAINAQVKFIKPKSKLLLQSDLIVNDSLKYQGRVVVDEPGIWLCRIDSEEPGAAAKEFRFEVKPSQFT